MPMDTEAVAHVVDDLRRMLQADGADLALVTADPRIDRIELALDVSGASCADCVLPPDQLRDVIAASLQRRVPTEFELILHDPRTAG
jgi:Fe-S cluster biogenesis protein NfuA